MTPIAHDGPVSRTRPPVDVVFAVYDGIQALDLTGPWEVFHGANGVLDELAPHRARYRLTLCSTDGRAIETESGLRIQTAAMAAVQSPHTLVIPGGFGSRLAADDPALVDGIRRLADGSDRVVTVCTGTFVAAAAGLCDGRRVATHWARAAALQRRFPSVDVDVEPIYVHDRNLWSSAGVTAGIDLALAIVEHDHSADIAQIVARWLVMFLRRPGGQTQFATPVWTERAELAPVRAAQDLIDADPGGDHRIGVIAAHVGMSERHFTRCFTEQTGTSPAQYVASVRVEAAKRALESSTLTVGAIARRSGFGSAETMRRTFARRLGVSPDQYRQRFRTGSVDVASTRTPTTARTPTSTRTSERSTA